MGTHRKAGEPKTKIEVWLQDFQKLRFEVKEFLDERITAAYLQDFLTELDNLYGPLT